MLFIRLFVFSFCLSSAVLAEEVVSYPRGISCDESMESQLLELPEWQTAEPSPGETSVSSSCFNASLDLFANWARDLGRRSSSFRRKNLYGYCTDEVSEPERSSKPICKSATYLNVIENSFDTVMHCLELAPSYVFAISAVESGFHINTLSAVGEDVGIGQISEIGSVEVNLQWEQLIAETRQSQNLYCQRLKKELAELQPVSGAWSESCQLIALPSNPVRNLLYQGFLFKIHSQYLERHFIASGTYNKLIHLLGRDLTDQELSRFHLMLQLLAYNAGIQATFDALDEFLLEKLNGEWGDEPFYVSESSVLRSDIARLYFDAIGARSIGDTVKADQLLAEREGLQRRLNEFEERELAGEDGVRLTILDLSGRIREGTFGKFLVDSGRSRYLSQLEGITARIGERVSGSSDACRSSSFLEVQKLTEPNRD